jgi:hypothetical protein
MRGQVSAAVGIAVLVGACDNSEPTQPKRAIVVRSEAQNRLHSLSDMNRHIALRRAIYDSGSACRRVLRSGYVQEYGNLSMWTASCGDGRNWAIFVGPDGTAQVRRCEEMQKLNLPICEIRARKRAG